MAAQYEIAFIQHLVLGDSLTEIVEHNLPDDLLPTEMLRQIHHFAVDYWHADGTKGTAPSPEAMRVHFGNELVEHEIDLDVDPEDTLPWTLSTLQSAYQQRFNSHWIKKFASASAEADLLTFPDVIDAGVADLMELQGKFVSVAEHQNVGESLERALRLYEEREELHRSGKIKGLLMGMPVRNFKDGVFIYPGGIVPTMTEVDEHTAGIRNGELCILAAPPKTGKSYFLLASAYKTWRHGGVPVIFSLENSVDMTIDRLICMASSVDYRRWDRGQCRPEEIQRYESFRQAFEKEAENHPFHILKPEPGKRTVEHMVRQARMLGDSLYIDQLSFVEPNPGDERLPAWKSIGNAMHNLKALIGSTSRHLPCMLAHQISRDGQKAAEKEGRLEMYHLAESAEVERTGDWVFGLWQDAMMKQGGVAYLQTLASRRADTVHWQLGWEPWKGYIECQGDVTASLGSDGAD